MNVTRFDEAPPFDPLADHIELRRMRLRGYAAGPSSALWLGCSVIKPGGGVKLGASPTKSTTSC